MPETIPPSIRDTLIDLRTQFLEHSRRHGSLYHALVEASHQLHHHFTLKTGLNLSVANARRGVLVRRSLLGYSLPRLGSSNLPRLGSYYFHRLGQGGGHAYNEQPEDAREQIISREIVLGTFRELATAAGRCLTGLPTEMRGLFPGAAEDPRLEALLTYDPSPGPGADPVWTEADYWSITLHRLGWQAYRRRPGTLLAVRPTLWEGINVGFVADVHERGAPMADWPTPWEGSNVEFVPAVHDGDEGESFMWSRIEANTIFDRNERGVRDLFLSYTSPLMLSDS